MQQFTQEFSSVKGGCILESGFYSFESICLPLLHILAKHIHYFLWIAEVLLVYIMLVLKTILKGRLHLFQHDAQMDYYGTRLATCSSDRTVKIFDVRNGGQILVADLRG